MITIDKVSKWYGSFQVLAECSTQVAKGEVVVVCGPSGSGKSTIIKCVNGLEPFQKGAINVDGISVGDPKTDLPKLRARIGMVFQNFELFPHMSVTDNLTLAQVKVLGRSQDEARQRGLKLLERVDALDEGGLAAAGGAADHHHLALGHFGGAVGQHLEGAVPLADVFDGDHRMMAILSCSCLTRRDSEYEMMK